MEKSEAEGVLTHNHLESNAPTFGATPSLSFIQS